MTHPPLLSLPPYRVAQEVHEAETAASWAAEVRRGLRREVWKGARVWLSGVWLIAWSAHTTNFDTGPIAFWSGALLGYLGLGWVGWVVCGHLADAA